ncbi:MAG: hypothetical protein DME34_00330 [Verrucomicrobia bacterium]|nr:MAG: hypothetical protein DME34_00330 [Verrucomicrobiota bacterium]
MQLSPEKKIAGVLAPLFGLRGDDDLGIGDVAVLREFVDWAAQIGFKLVQLLPINETGGDHSPYNAISAMAIEPTTLHLAPGSPVELKRKDFDAVLADVDPSTGFRTNLAELRQNGVKYRRVFRRCDQRSTTTLPHVLRGRSGLAGELRPVSRVDGGERRERSMGPLAERAADNRFRARLVGSTIA